MTPAHRSFKSLKGCEPQVENHWCNSLTAVCRNRLRMRHPAGGHTRPPVSEWVPEVGTLKCCKGETLEKHRALGRSASARPLSDWHALLLLVA